MKTAVEVKDIPCLRLLHLSSIIVDVQQGSKWTNAIRLSKMSCYTGLSADGLTQQDNSQVAAQPWVCLFLPLALGQLYERGFFLNITQLLFLIHANTVCVQARAPTLLSWFQIHIQIQRNVSILPDIAFRKL